MKLFFIIVGGIVAAVLLLAMCSAVIDEMEYQACVSEMKKRSGYGEYSAFAKAGCRIGSKLN